MRRFSEKEKSIIQLLLKGVADSDAYLPINVYNHIFYREHVEFDVQKMQLVFYVPEEALSNDNHKKMLDVYYEILEISLLLDYLQKEGLLYQISMQSVNQLNKVGGFCKNDLSGISMNIDHQIGQILFRCMNNPIFVSQTLKDLVANNFISLEEQTLLEAVKQTQISCRTMVLSVIAIIVSIISIFINVA